MRWLLFILLFCGMSVYAQPDSYFLMDGYFKGNPRKVTTRTFISKGSADSLVSLEEESLDWKVQIDNFDSNGNCLSHQWLDVNGNVDSEFKFTYDKSGNRIESVYLKPGFNLRREVFVFDSNQNEIASVAYDTLNQVISRTYYATEVNDSVKVKVARNGEKKLKKREETYYDEEGRRTRQVRFNKDSIVQYDFRYYYNDQNKLKSVVSSRGGTDLTFCRYAYDSLGRETEYSCSKNRSSVSSSREITIFSDDSNKVEVLYYSYSHLDKKITRYLNVNGSIMREINVQYYSPVLIGYVENEDPKTYEKSRTREIEYTYDNQLNWVKKVEFYNGKLSKIQKRAFEY